MTVHVQLGCSLQYCLSLHCRCCCCCCRLHRAAGLLSEAAAAVAAGDAATAAGEEAVGVVQRALVWPLEALAQQHHCHELLYDTCELLLTTGLLDGQRVLMHMQSEVEAAGGALPANSFTFYVMERCGGLPGCGSVVQGCAGVLENLCCTVPMS